MQALDRTWPETLYFARVLSSPGMDVQLRQFSDAMRRQMSVQQLTAPQLAKMAGTSPKTINNILHGRHAPQLDKLIAIAEALNIDFWQFFFPDLPADIGHDSSFPGLVSDLAQLPVEARKSIARIIQLELKDRK